MEISLDYNTILIIFVGSVVTWCGWITRITFENRTCIKRIEQKEADYEKFHKEYADMVEKNLNDRIDKL